MNVFQDPNDVVYADEPEDTGSESYSFDAADLPGNQQLQAQQPQYQFQGTTRPDPLMFEAQRRMRKASYYQTFLDGPLLEGVGNDPTAAEVEKEFKAFVVQKYQELLGIAAIKPPEKSLTEDEVVILKEFVQTVKARKGQPQKVTVPQQVVQAPQPPPPAPVRVQPVQVPPPVPAVPKVRRRRLPNGSTPQQEQKAATQTPQKRKRPILPNGQVAPNLDGTNIRPLPTMTPQMQEVGMQMHARTGNSVTQEFDANGRPVGGNPK